MTKTNGLTAREFREQMLTTPGSDSESAQTQVEGVTLPGIR